MEQTDLQGMLSALTKNPELMGKLRQIAGGLAASSAQAEEPIGKQAEAPPTTTATRILRDFGSRKQLLVSLRPFLKETRKKKLDEILNLLCLLEAAESSGLLSQFLSVAKTQEVPHVSS